MIKLIRQVYRNERGIALIELALAIAITAILATGFTMTFHQVATANARSAAHMTAVKQVESALYWINRDVQMSQEIVTGNDPIGTGFPLTLSWTDYSGSNDYQVVYSLSGNTIVRTYSVT
jgi:type II secretory pathway component PulJ